jgi:hypothetical protein
VKTLDARSMSTDSQSGLSRLAKGFDCFGF